MLCLSFEYGMVTDSWYAELALRRRVSMSAIGSVIVIGALALPHRGFRRPDLRRSRLPAALRDARELAGKGHLAQADAAQAELAVDRVRTAAPLAPGVGAHRELRLAVRLLDQGSLRHVSSP